MRRGGAWESVLGNRWALALVVPLVLVLGGLVFYPLAKLTIDSLTTGAGLGNYAAVFESSAGRRSLITTFLAAALVSVAAVVLGGLLAWYIRTARSSAVKVVLWLAVLVPFWMGTVVKNYSIVLLLSAEGPLGKLCEALGLGSLSVLYTSAAVAIGMVYTMVPYAALTLYGVFLTVDESLLDAARGMGASRLYAARTVVLPLALP
ncbi:MAG TPA: ABC transporter permease subunit, partial [Solirubrobacteraceae bacterium]